MEKAACPGDSDGCADILETCLSVILRRNLCKMAIAIQGKIWYTILKENDTSERSIL